MAEELILTEELEKKGCKRKKKKIQPVKKHKNPDYPCEKCVKNECEIKVWRQTRAQKYVGKGALLDGDIAVEGEAGTVRINSPYKSHI